MKSWKSSAWVLLVLSSLILSALSAQAAAPKSAPDPQPNTQIVPGDPSPNADPRTAPKDRRRIPIMPLQNGGDTSAGAMGASGGTGAAHSADGKLLDFKEREGIEKIQVETQDVYAKHILPRLKQLEALDPKLVKLMKESFEDRRWFWDAGELVCDPTTTMRDLDLKVRACQDKYEVRLSLSDLASASEREIAGTIAHEMFRYARFMEKPECAHPLLREECEKDVRQLNAQFFEGNAIDPKEMSWVLKKAGFKYSPKKAAPAPDQAIEQGDVGEKAANEEPVPLYSGRPLAQDILELLCSTERVILEEQIQELRQREKKEREQVIAVARPRVAEDAAFLNGLFERLDLAADRGLRSMAREYAESYANLAAALKKRGLHQQDEAAALSIFDGRYRRQLFPAMEDLIRKEIPEMKGQHVYEYTETPYFYSNGFQFQVFVEKGKVALLASNPISFPTDRGAQAIVRRKFEVATGARKGVPRTSDPAQVPVYVIEDALNIQAFNQWDYGLDEGNRLAATSEISKIESSGFLQSCRKLEKDQQLAATDKSKTVPSKGADGSAELKSTGQAK